MSVRGSKLIERVEESVVVVGAKISRKQMTYPPFFVPLKIRCAKVDCHESEHFSKKSSRMRPLPAIPSSVAFQVKENNSGYLCKMHATQLSRLVRSKDTKVSDSQEIIEEATWSSVPESQEEQEEVVSVTRKEANITTKPAGRPD